MTKSLPISKRMVYNSYLKVVSKDGSAGIDKQSIEMFNEDLADNLYKLWNRMASGSYFPPPVRTVFIPKKQGGKRPLGIPTVGDRIAQGVVKDYLEPIVDTIFHPGSFGYRPGKSAHDAIKQCQDNCIRYAWVIDVDIKGFFDNLNHEKMMQLLQEHTTEKWVLMYAERWLKAGVEQEDGGITARTKGTPQGGVISPLFANIYLHHCFDKWMDEVNPQIPFERYADDIVIHCSSKEEAGQLLEKLKVRMHQHELELHPDKTKIVYCKNYLRKDTHDNNSFTFLSYSFQPRTVKDKFGRINRIVMFNAAISQPAKASIRSKLREVLNPQWSNQTLTWFADKLNPKIRGWINYYARFNRHIAYDVFYYLNERIRQWIKNTYKIRGKAWLYDKYRAIQAANPELFYHWRLGIKA
ncbi:MAG: group II intron reverse transcriptase/maturase [Bacteroidota bacterium]|nr:group II intron reverse transcriptase/maturase [Bacteroidota bacterium]